MAMAKKMKDKVSVKVVVDKKPKGKAKVMKDKKMAMVMKGKC